MKSLCLALILCLLPSLSFAQGNVGNGGGGYEPEFKYLGGVLIQWIRLGALNLDTRKISKKINWNEILTAIETIPFEFTDRELTVYDSTPRACKNYPNPDPSLRKIECNYKAWDAVPNSQKLAVVFHEYLGATDYETNLGKYSSYPLSSQLIGITLGSDKDTPSISDYLESVQHEGGTEVRVAPAAILQWVRLFLHKGSSLLVRPNGVISLTGNSHERNQTHLEGEYLTNGDYQIKGVFYEKITSTMIGEDRLTMRQSGGGCGTTFSLTLIWDEKIGLKSVTALSNCAYQSDGGPTLARTEIQQDGSVKIEKYEKTWGVSGPIIKIWVNDQLYHMNYLSPKFIQR